MATVIWHEAQVQIDGCHLCEQQNVSYLVVPVGSKRHPPHGPPQPTRLLFISVAPPWGGAYFWDESQPDNVREGLFDALARATGERFKNVREFWEAGYFLLPGVKCTSQFDDKDHRPLIKAIKNCASHLESEVNIAQPERILTLGRDPLKSVAEALNLKVPSRVRDYRQKLRWGNVSGRLIPVAGTYFPGNKRHKGFENIVEDIRWILAQKPQSASGE